MSAKPEKKTAGSPNAGPCLTRSVLQVLEEDPRLEAVTIDRDKQTISVATLGQADVPKLTERITATLQHATQDDTGHYCSLLSNAGDCLTCVRPLSETERQRITIRHDAASTTIARVTCPTAPTFWRWDKRHARWW